MYSRYLHNQYQDNWGIIKIADPPAEAYRTFGTKTALPLESKDERFIDKGG